MAYIKYQSKYRPEVKNCKEVEKNVAWIDHHNKCALRCDEYADVVLYGASNIQHYEEFKWVQRFGKKVLNFGYGGDRIQNLMYRLWFGRIPKYIKVIVVHIGTNNVKNDTIHEIVKGIYDICEIIRHIRPNVDVIATGLIPGTDRPVQKVTTINNELARLFKCRKSSKRTFYIAPDMKDWTKKGGKKIKDDLFSHDLIHFSPAGYDVFIPYIQKISMDTCLPLVPPTDRDGCLEDPYKHLAIGMSELALGDEPPRLWNTRINSGAKFVTTHEHCVNVEWARGRGRGHGHGSCS